jgi:hypothetical protein
MKPTSEAIMKHDTSDRQGVDQVVSHNIRLGKYLKVAVRSGFVNATICFEKDVRDFFFDWIENERRQSCDT